MAKNKENFYIAKGENDTYPWLFYGEQPPIINNQGECTYCSVKCRLIGSFTNNNIADSIKDNEIVKVYIRKEIKKNK